MWWLECGREALRGRVGFLMSHAVPSRVGLRARPIQKHPKTSARCDLRRYRGYRSQSPALHLTNKSDPWLQCSRETAFLRSPQSVSQDLFTTSVQTLSPAGASQKPTEFPGVSIAPWRCAGDLTEQNETSRSGEDPGYPPSRVLSNASIAIIQCYLTPSPRIRALKIRPGMHSHSLAPQ